MGIATIIITLVLIISFIIYRSKYENRIERKWLRLTIESILVLLIMPLLVTLIAPVVQFKQRREETRFKKDILASCVKKELDYEDLKELITLKHKDIFQSTDETATKWADDFIKSLPEKQSGLESLLDKGKELEKRLTLKWQPLYEFILKEFDARVLKLKENDFIESFNKKEQSIFRKDAFEGYNTQIRTLVFHNGSYIWIEFRPALMQGGVIREEPSIRFWEIINGVRNVDGIRLIFGDKEIQFTYKNKVFRTTEKDPLDDAEFRKKLIEAIGNTITSGYLLDAQ